VTSFIALAVVLSTIAASGSGLAVENDGCPPWTYQRKSSCECGVTLQEKVKCNLSNSELLLHYCLCMTYDNKTSKTVVGYCVYSCIANAMHHEVVLPMKTAELDSKMCGAWNRRGQLCSQCREGYGVPLYSYDFIVSSAKNFR